MKTYIDGFDTAQEVVVSVEDELRRKLPLERLFALEVLGEAAAVVVVRGSEGAQDAHRYRHLLYRLLHLALEDFRRLQVVPTLNGDRPSILQHNRQILQSASKSNQRTQNTHGKRTL